MDTVEKWRTRLDPIEHLRLCEIALKYVPFFLRQSVGPVHCPALDHLYTYYAAVGDDSSVARLRTFIISEPRLGDFGFLAGRAAKDLEIAKAVIQEVCANPGISQFTLRERLAVPKGAMASLLRHMEAFGRIRRVPTGKTNRVYLGEDGSFQGSGV